jgi:hypothetical protein
MPAELWETDRHLHDVLQLVRARLARLRPVRIDADFERLVVEFTLTQLHEETRLEDDEISRLRRACDQMLDERGTLRVG